MLDDTIAAHRRHVDVIVFTRPDASNDAALRRLRSAGVRVVTVRNLHEKVVLADDRVLNPSTNFTRTALAVDENPGTVHSASRLVDAFVAGFDLMRDGQDRVTGGEETFETPTGEQTLSGVHIDTPYETADLWFDAEGLMQRCVLDRMGVTMTIRRLAGPG